MKPMAFDAEGTLDERLSREPETEAEALRQVVDSQMALGHKMTIVPTDVLVRLLALIEGSDPASPEPGYAVEPTTTAYVTETPFSEASPERGQRFYRTDLDTNFEYDGTHWLPVIPEASPAPATEPLDDVGAAYEVGRQVGQREAREEIAREQLNATEPRCIHGSECVECQLDRRDAATAPRSLSEPLAAAPVAGSTIPPLDVFAPIVEEAVQDTWPSGDADVLYARSRHIAERILARLAGSTEPVTEEPR